MSVATTEAPELLRPAHLWVPEHTSTAGGEAIDLAAEVGITLDAEQRLAVNAILAERPDGRWAAFEAAICCPRQNLKTFVFEVVVLADLYLFDSDLIVWTAHEFKTAMEAFLDFKTLIEANPILSRRVRKVLEANGEEGVEFITGQRLNFRARTKTGGRGLTGDRTILDEAQELVASMMGSLMPTMSARSQTGNPQILYGGSAGKDSSAVWRQIRDRGRPGGARRLAWIEWCAERQSCATERCTHRPGVVGCRLDDEEGWKVANPALGRRISVEWIRDTERLSMTPDEFARERLGWWEDPEESAGLGVPLDAWRECQDRTSELAAVSALAIDVAMDGAWSAIAAAGPRADGRPHIEVVENRRGTEWVVERLAELKDAHGVEVVAIDPKGPARCLLDELADADIALTEADAASMPTACASLVDDLNRRWLRHLGQGELDMAVRVAVRRPVGDAWVFSRKNSPADISPLVAVTLAKWAAGLAVVEEVNVEPFMVVS